MLLFLMVDEPRKYGKRDVASAVGSISSSITDKKTHNRQQQLPFKITENDLTLVK